MGTRLTVPSLRLRTGKLGMFFCPAQRNRGCDVIAIAMCLLLSSVGYCKIQLVYAAHGAFVGFEYPLGLALAVLQVWDC
jgi:hypothetical protein